MRYGERLWVKLIDRINPFLFDELKACSAHISNLFAETKIINLAQPQPPVHLNKSLSLYVETPMG